MTEPGFDADLLYGKPDLAAREYCRKTRQALNYFVAIIDDDPTGSQTLYDVPLLGIWTVEALEQAMKTGHGACIVLANTRSLPESAAVRRVEQIARNLRLASLNAGCELLLISRSDSTLRGHFPGEIDALWPVCWREDACLFFAPAMFEGGRVTIGDVHYVREGEALIPVAETVYAQDPVFAYHHSHLPSWLEEKSRGRIPVEDVLSLSIRDLTMGGPLPVCQPGTTILINAAHYGHMDLAAKVIWEMVSRQQEVPVLIRSSSSLLPSILGLPPRGLLERSEVSSGLPAGGLVVVGSFVPKTSVQLIRLLEAEPDLIQVEFEPYLMLEEGAVQYGGRLATNISAALAAGKHVVVYTSRSLVQTRDGNAHLNLGEIISMGLVTLVQKLTARPAFVVAKGGITSHVLAVDGLGMEQSMVLGQIMPGVPVWEMGAETRFPGLPYVVFPGNVGADDSLLEVFRSLT